MSTDMIKGTNITKTFDGFTALNSLSFHVPKGAVYGLVGPNGAGKSTLIRHITGTFRPDSGQITIDGRDVYTDITVKSKMAYIPDDIFFFRQASLKDMKNYYAGIYESFDKNYFDDMLGRFPALKEKSVMRRMSKGMQKQAAFLLAASIRPEVLVLDEPVDGLDPVMRRQIWNILLDDVAKREMTVLVSSHNLRELEDVCDHVGILHKGELLIERSLKDLQQGISKIQTAYEADSLKLPEDFEVLHESVLGKVHTLIIRAEQEEIIKYFESEATLLFDLIPLTLEEIFIYELGGEKYEITEIID